ncbi:MAG: DNA-directed RNA polymerase subunit beta', partial [Chloroflexi bacterium]|nr:DNA-directed RNA polymerase subunit beta' [Chloroflexota bacterium]
EGRSIRVVSAEEYSDEYPLSAGYNLQVQDGDMVTIGATLATAEASEAESEDSAALQPLEIIARVSGVVHVEGDMLTISWTDEDQREYIIPAAANITVRTGDSVTAGQALTSGPKSPQQILRIQGREAVQTYLIDEVQKVYRSQGVSIHDKHIEIIISQMLRKVRIDTPGDTELLPGELVDRQPFEDVNASVLAEGGEPSTASPVLLGITRASLNMESFLAAASFQETTRVLTESAVNGDVDYLRGLKENVIIGRLIPARLDMSEEGRKRLGIKEPQLQQPQQPVGILAEVADEEIIDDDDDDILFDETMGDELIGDTTVEEEAFSSDDN